MQKEYDLNKLKRRPGKPKTSKQAERVSITMRLDGSDLAALKTEAEKKGLPYQTFINSILHQYLNGELIETKTVSLLKKLKA